MTEKEMVLKNRYQLLGEKVVKNLKSRNFDAYYCGSKEEALNQATMLMDSGATVTWGGSMSISEIGLIDYVYRHDFKIIDRDRATSPKERNDFMRQAFFADYYLTSFNAVSEDGVLMNIDGMGNRVAAIAFGPENVIAIVGMNKVCKDVDMALSRARNIAAPLNVQRCNMNPHFASITKTPCAMNGSCADCKVAEGICSYIVETRMCKIPGRIKVILVGEDLGL